MYHNLFLSQNFLYSCSGKHCGRKNICLTLSQTSPGFQVSGIQVFWRHWEKEKLLVKSNFSFSHSVFHPFGKLSAIFIKFRIVVCKLLQFGRVQNLLFGKGLQQLNALNPAMLDQEYHRVVFLERKNQNFTCRMSSWAHVHTLLTHLDEKCSVKWMFNAPK